MSIINFHNQDCMEAMAAMPDKAFDLAIVDPPYGIGKRLSQGAGKLKRTSLQNMDSSWDIAPDEKYFNLLLKISNNQIIFGGNYFILPPTRGIVCWDKCQPWPNFSAWEFIWTSFDSPAKIYKGKPNGFMLNGEDVDRIHPTQKPVALYRWLLDNYAKPGDRIIDTHGGSMSIAIACHDLGFDLELYEIDEDYFKAGADRLKRHQAQGKLF